MEAKEFIWGYTQSKEERNLGGPTVLRLQSLRWSERHMQFLKWSIADFLQFAKRRKEIITPRISPFSSLKDLQTPA